MLDSKENNIPLIKKPSEKLSQNLSEEYKKLSLSKYNSFNKRIYYTLKETFLKNEKLNLIFIGKKPENFNLRISDNDIEILSIILKPVCNLIYNIDFSNNNISEKSILFLGNIIENCVNLKSLNLQYNILGSNGGKILFKSLVNLKKKENYSLTYLNLEGCRIQTDGLLEINYEDKLYNGKKSLIEKFLNNNNKLEELNIGENEIDETGLIETFSLLNSNVNFCTLKNLSIDSPKKLLFTEETAYQLSKVLKTNKYLEKLSLRKSGLTDESLIILLKEVLENENLRVLDLGGNHISYKGCEYLSKYLESPYCNLQSLILNNNEIRNSGINNLVKGFIKNETVVHLNLNHNGITDEGLSKIALLMGNNGFLISLHIFWNDFGEKSRKIFFDLLKNTSRGLNLDFFIEKEDDIYKIYQYEQKLPLNIFVTRKHFIDDL